MPEEAGGKKIPLIGLGIIALVILSGGAWWLWQNGDLSSAQDEQSRNISQELQIQAREISKWETLDFAKPIKVTAPISYFNDPILVFKIGSITDGEFKGKILAFAASKSSVDGFVDKNNASNSTLYDYSYFVSDEMGNPIAWDKSFIHNPDDRCETPGVQGCERHYLTMQQLGLTDNLQKPLTFIPKELRNTSNLTSAEKKAYLKIVYSGALANIDAAPTDLLQVDTTESGWQIMKNRKTNPEGNPDAILPEFLYYIALPFGKMIQISPEPDFVDANDVPQLTWTSGTTSVMSYRYGQYAYGWQDCYEGISAGQLQSTFVQTGKTAKGDFVYEVDAQKYPKVYVCLHEKTKRYVYDATTQKGTYQETVSYADFVQSHPMFFWRHPYGDLMAFIRSDVVPAAEKAKPVIYLYPQKPEKVSVNVSPIGGFIKTDPDYGNGWIVDATPSGVITNSKDGKQYPYLFWEGGKDGIVLTPKQGFVIASGDIPAVLENRLSQFGLNKQERYDFLEFWVPKLSRAPYYFVTFIPQSEIDRTAPMDIYPRPDTVIRVLMDYKPLTQPISVEPLTITSTKRNGFTVVEWGGIVRD